MGSNPIFWPTPSPASPLPFIMANTLPAIPSANSIPYGVALPSPATVTPNAGRVRSGKHSATTARVKHPRDKRRRAREGKRGEEGGNERKRQKMEIVAWEIEDGSVVCAGTVYWMEADLTLGDPSTYLEIRSHHRPQIDKEDRVNKNFFFFFVSPACPKFPTRPRLLLGTI